MFGLLKFNSVQRNVKNFKYITSSYHRSICNISLLKQKSAVSFNKGFTSSMPVTKESKYTELHLSEYKECMNYWPGLIRDLTVDDTFIAVPAVRERYVRLLEYTAKITRYTSPIALSLFFKTIEKPENLTAEHLKRCYVAAWCVIMFQCAFQITDDLEDNTDVRNNVLTWHNKKDVGLTVLSDSFLLNHGITFLLKKYFSHHPSLLITLIEIFCEQNIFLAMGQVLDDSYHPLETITLEHQNSCWRYKTENNVYLLPIHLGMVIANKFDASQFQRMAPVLRNMSRYIQLKNDYTDIFYYTEHDLVGGTDVGQGKCTSAAVFALNTANSSQREIMKQHYGKPEKESIEAIKKLFIDLGVPDNFRKEKEKLFNNIKDEIDSFPKEYPRAALHKVLNLAYDDTLN